MSNTASFLDLESTQVTREQLGIDDSLELINSQDTVASLTGLEPNNDIEGHADTSDVNNDDEAVDSSSMSARPISTGKVVINELLCYATHYHKAAMPENTIKMISRHFTDDDIIRAKDV